MMTRKSISLVIIFIQNNTNSVSIVNERTQQSRKKNEILDDLAAYFNVNFRLTRHLLVG